MTATDDLIVEVTRGGYVESVHRVAACAVDSRGTLLEAAGEIDVPVFIRSAAKPFIAAAVVAADAGERFGLEPRDIAVMAASHSGQPFHIETVRSILHKIGMDESALQCGAHEPYDEAAAKALREAGLAPTALHNNCSGKHAGILALCVATGADPATYLSLENPAQRRILEFCARCSDDDAATWPLGVDGCGIPVYATSLRKAAMSFARLATQAGMDDAQAHALRVVRDAMVAHPEHVSGTGQIDTELIRVGDGKLVSKAGAEGVAGVAAIPQGYGYVSKVLDGSGRARGPALIAGLRRLGVLDERQVATLARFARPAVYNRAGNKVGEIVSRV